MGRSIRVKINKPSVSPYLHAHDPGMAVSSDVIHVACSVATSTVWLYWFERKLRDKQ